MRLFTLAAALLVSTGVQAADVTINYWSMWNQNEPIADVIEAAIAEFETANPTIDVVVNWAGRDVRKLILPALASGQSIDVVENGNDWLMNPDHAPNWLPIQDYVNAPGPDGAPALADEIIAPLLNQYAENGELRVVPTQPFAVVYFYNQDHFEQAGITSVPTTWAEFIEAGKALRAAGFDPVTIDPDAYLAINFGYHALRALGSCDALHEVITDRTGEAWKQPAIVAMAQDIVDARAADLYSAHLEGNRFPAGQQDVALGVASMMVNGTWLPNEVAETAGPDFRWGSFSYPAVTGGAGDTGDIMMGAQALAITKDSAHPDEAFALIRHLMSKSVHEKLVADAGVTSSRLDVEWPANIAGAREAVLEAENAIGWNCNISSAGEVVGNVVVPTFGELLYGKLDAQAYADAMAERSASFWSTR